VCAPPVRAPRELKGAAAGALLAASLLFGASAHATDPVQAAQALFDEGLSLMAEQRYELACAKFERSLLLDDGVGTRFRLGDCYEKLGRTASAWFLYGRVVDLCAERHDAEREAYARARRDAVETRLARLTVRVVRPSAGLSVARNGVVLPAELYGSAVPVDPGNYVITAEAPGFVSTTLRVSVPEGPAALVVEVPELELIAAATPAQTSPPFTSRAREPASAADDRIRHKKRLRSGAWITAGAGGAAVLTGGVYWAAGFSAWSRSRRSCDGTRCSEREGADLSERAVRHGRTGTAWIAGGAVLGAASVPLFLWSRGASAEPASPVAEYRLGACTLDAPWTVCVAGTF
jgi:hypothetical protein